MNLDKWEVMKGLNTMTRILQGFPNRTLWSNSPRQKSKRWKRYKGFLWGFFWFFFFTRGRGCKSWPLPLTTARARVGARSWTAKWHDRICLLEGSVLAPAWLSVSVCLTEFLWLKLLTSLHISLKPQEVAPPSSLCWSALHAINGLRECLLKLDQEKKTHLFILGCLEESGDTLL